nr:hypothetical protein [uncultured Desulfobacter sp.]
MQLDDFISYEALEDTFSDEGEDLENDISSIHVEGIVYCKEMFIDFSVDVFGADGVGGLPLYSEVMPLKSNYVISVPVISTLFVLKMFDTRILKLLSEKKLFIAWNPSWKTASTIDPMAPDLSLVLSPEKN